MMPKIELHLHLDGSVTFDTASILSNKPINEIKKEMEAPLKCEDLSEYLTKFSFPIELMQTKENLIKIAFDLAQNLIKDGVIYAEIRFAPINHINGGLSLHEVVDSVLEGLSKVPLKTNLILCMMRNSTVEDNKKIINLAKDYLNRGVVALDLAGDEYKYKTSTFRELFKYASELQIPFTIHAGEADGIDSIKDALSFGTKRLGHGIRCTENIELCNYLKENNILLEICPTSNVQTNVVDSITNHPIKKLYDMGLKLCINTDNRTVSNTSLELEYLKLKEAFKLTDNDFKNMNLNAIRFSFLSDIEKETLEREYLDKYNLYIKRIN